MVKIGLLSDTHGYLDDHIFKFFENCNEIWHAGDFGGIEIADKLTQFKLLRGVYGNADGKEIRLMFPEKQRFYVERVNVLLTHIAGYPGKYDKLIKEEIVKRPPKLLVCGHSHILKVMYDKQYNLLCINPGAAGRYGVQCAKTFIRFTIDDDKIKDLEVIELPLK